MSSGVRIVCKTIRPRAVVALAGLAALALAGCDRMAKGVHDAVRDTEAASVDALPADSIIGRLRQDFPQDYAELRGQAAELAASGGSADQISALSRRYMLRFYAAHQGQLEQAPAGDLVKLARVDADMLAAAQASEGDAACATIWGGGVKTGGNPPQMRAALEQLGQARIAAIRDGADHPVAREAAQLAATDRDALNAGAARRGVTAEQIATSRRLAPADECRVGRTVFSAIAALPADQAARLMAFLTHAEAAARASASQAGG